MGKLLPAIEINKRYINRHTKIPCIVKQLIFFNVQYKEDNDKKVYYIHYRKFRKNWVVEKGVR